MKTLFSCLIVGFAGNALAEPCRDISSVVDGLTVDKGRWVASGIICVDATRFKPPILRGDYTITVERDGKGQVIRYVLTPKAPGARGRVVVADIVDAYAVDLVQN